MRFLCVEDDEANFRLIERVLRLDGHEVERARDGETALRMVSAQRPGLVLMDLALPGIDGFETARRMRDVPSLAGVPIVVVTGRVSRADRRRAVADGFDGFVEKPFRVETLRAEVRRVLGDHADGAGSEADARRAPAGKDARSR